MLGEVYRIQKSIGLSTASEGRIFGLLNGLEESIDEELNTLQEINKEKVDAVRDYLDPYYQKKLPLSELPNQTEVRLELEKARITEGEFTTILKYLKANNMYTLEIDKLGNYSLNEHDL